MLAPDFEQHAYPDDQTHGWIYAFPGPRKLLLVQQNYQSIQLNRSEVRKHPTLVYCKIQRVAFGYLPASNRFGNHSLAKKKLRAQQRNNQRNYWFHLTNLRKQNITKLKY